MCCTYMAVRTSGYITFFIGTPVGNTCIQQCVHNISVCIFNNLLGDNPNRNMHSCKLFLHSKSAFVLHLTSALEPLEALIK